MDLSMAVAAIFFTNIANHVNATRAASGPQGTGPQVR